MHRERSGCLTILGESGCWGDLGGESSKLEEV
jgi:hypothetical protein